MNLATELQADEMLDDAVSDTSDPIGVTFASGVYENDLLSYLENASRLAREVC